MKFRIGKYTIRIYKHRGPRVKKWNGDLKTVNGGDTVVVPGEIDEPKKLKSDIYSSDESVDSVALLGE